MLILIFLVAVGLADIASLNVSQEDFDNLVKQVSLLEATVEGLEDQNASTIVKIAELEAAAEDHEYQIAELQNDNERLAAQNENLIERVTRLEASFFGLHSHRTMDHRLWFINYRHAACPRYLIYILDKNIWSNESSRVMPGIL